MVSIGLFRINDKYTEEEWNDEAVEDVKAKGKESNGLMKYMASKTLAERGAIIFIMLSCPECLPTVYGSCLGTVQ